MNARDRRTVLGALTIAVVGTALGIISGAYQVPPSVQPTTPPAHALPCAAFDSGAPAGDYIGGVCYQSATTTTPEGVFPTIDTSSYGTDISRCWTDDSNTKHVGRCYTEGEGFVTILDADDQVVAVLK